MNKQLFKKPTFINQAGGTAYQMDAKSALAQLAVTGCFSNTFYASATDQLNEMLALAEKVDTHFLAKLAIYSRHYGYMKDMPAALTMLISRRDKELLHSIFPKVIDNGKMLRSLFNMAVSGKFGVRGLSSSLQRAYQNWFLSASPQRLLLASIGNDPSMRDMLRMVRPKPKSEEQSAMFAWLLDKKVDGSLLPQSFLDLETYNNTKLSEVQISIIERNAFRWDMLAGKAINRDVWVAIAERMGIQALRMNLNTLARHGVFDDVEMVTSIAQKLSDPQEIILSRQFPFQFFSSYFHSQAPQPIKSALSKAAELACGNIPKVNGNVLIGIDTSGSMQTSITPNNSMACVDVAELFGAAMLHKNPQATIYCFDTELTKPDLDADDSIFTITKKIRRFGGGTDCTLPIREAVQSSTTYDSIIIVSDNQSWRHSGRSDSEWEKMQRKNPHCKLVLIDIQPYTNTMVQNAHNVLNIGGFSDAVFNVVADFLNGEGNWVGKIEEMEI